jgi:hypothetical protein
MARQRALVLGDGDFAFSARFSNAGHFDVTATTVEAEADLEARYPDTFPRHREQVVQKGGRCLFGIDALKLDSTHAPYCDFRGAFMRVIWHNPYTAGAELQTHRTLVAQKVHKHLVADFMACAPAVLSPGGTLVVSINPSSALVGEEFLLACASGSGFALLRSYPFEQKREHEFVLRYGDDRDLAKTRRTYTKRSIRTYEFERAGSPAAAAAADPAGGGGQLHHRRGRSMSTDSPGPGEQKQPAVAAIRARATTDFRSVWVRFVLLVGVLVGLWVKIVLLPELQLL